MAAIFNITILFNLILMVVTPSLVSPPAQLSAASVVVSNSGIFSVPLAEGDWTEFANIYDPTRERADIILTSQQELTIVQAFVLLNQEYGDTQTLNDELFTEDFFTLEWSDGYEQTNIIGRTVGERFLTLDFDLRAGGQSFVGRQISWQESGHIFNLRFVVPPDRVSLLGDLQRLYIEKYTFYPDMLGTPLSNTQIVTPSIVDVMVKLPVGWIESRQPDSGIVGYTNQLDLQVFIWQIEDELDLDDYEAVTAWILGFRDNMHMLDGRRVDQTFGSGYLFSYTFEDETAGSVSAALAMFPSHDGGLNLVEVGSNSPDTNLLDGDENPVARAVLDSVTLLAPDDYVYIELE
ncbi:MAG: hypothetical protein L0154_18525 [Chloroflexi bacterium]|nr:hypothetical protein [Chloroflexota bacterium]